MIAEHDFIVLRVLAMYALTGLNKANRRSCVYEERRLITLLSIESTNLVPKSLVREQMF